MLSDARRQIQDLCSGEPLLDAGALFAREAQFLECLSGGALTALINEELAALVKAPTNTPPRSTETGWAVFDGNACALRLMRLPQNAQENGYHLQGPATHRMLSIVSTCVAAEIACYRHEQGDAARFDPTNRLVRKPVRLVRAGEVVRLRAWRDVAEWQPRTDLVLCAALISPVAVDQYWVYRRDTLQPIELISATYALNRLQYALELLAAIGGASHAPTTAALYGHSAHHIRWAAIKATLDLDAELGRSLLRQAVDDPHPHVASAAAAGLRALEQLDV